MRIGLVTGEYPPMQGGVGDFSRALALALATLGHEVHVIAHRRAQADPPLSMHPMVDGWGPRAIWWIRSLVRSLALDVVNIQYQAAAYGMTAPIHILPALAGAPSVVTFHDLRVPYLFPKAGPLRRAAVNLIARSATGVIATNAEDRMALARDARVRRLAEIPIGSNILPAATHYGARSQHHAARWGLAEAATVVGYFGFLNRSKGGETLLRAIAKLPRARLLLVGGRTGTSDPTNAAYADSLDALAHDLGISDRIVRTDYLPPRETSEALMACDLMAMPYVDGASFRRGTFIACFAHGIPTISTQPTVALPQLRDGENIRLVAREDPDALASAIGQLSADPVLRTRLSAGATKLAGQFTWDKIAAQTVQFFHQVTARPIDSPKQ